MKPIWGYQKKITHLRKKRSKAYTAQERRRNIRTKRQTNNGTMGKLDKEELPNNTRTRNPRNTTYNRTAMEQIQTEIQPQEGKENKRRRKTNQHPLGTAAHQEKLTTRENNPGQPTSGEMAHRKIHRKEVRKTIQHLRNRKSHGMDGIPGEVYKALGEWIIKPMTIILNKIHQGDEIPPEWKKKEP